MLEAEADHPTNHESKKETFLYSCLVVMVTGLFQQTRQGIVVHYAVAVCFFLISTSINRISGNTIPNRPILWKDETITAPVTAPKIKLIHMGARTSMVSRAESLEKSSLGLRFEEKWSKLFCISAVTTKCCNFTVTL
jgi:hypothetical protein